MKEVLRAHVKNPITLKFVLENIRLDGDSKFKWRFNVTVLEQMLRHWTQVKQINYGHQCKGKLMNIVTKNNYITSEDYLDFKKAFKHCQVEHLNTRYMLNNSNKLGFIKTIEEFVLS